MALVIDYTEDLKVDEDQGTPVNDPNELALPAIGSVATALSSIDTTNNFATGLSTVQVAMEDTFFTFDDTGGEATGLSLTLAAGAPYPTTAGNGIEVPFTTASGDTIYLFQGPTSDTVKCVIGDDPAGEVVFVLHLEEVSSGGELTGAKLWVVQFEPLYHPDGTAVEDDLLDLTDLVYVSTMSVTTSVASDFSDVPAGAPIFAMIADDQNGDVQFLATAFNASAPTTPITVNVSNQGSFPGSLASGSQNITPGTAMRFDLVTGGDTVYTQSEGKLAENITFTDHAPDITQAGFTIVQNQGGRPTDLKIAAYTIPDDMDGADTDGTAFFSTLNNQGPIEEIDAVRIYEIDPATGLPVAGSDHTYLRSGGNVAGVVTFNADGTVTALNLGLNDTVEIIVNEGGLDRFTVTNVDSQKNAYVDIGRLTYTSEIPSEEAQEIGSRIFFDDSGPTVTAGTLGAQSLLTDDTTLGTDDTEDFSGLFDVDFGSDGAGASGPVYTLSTAGGATGVFDTATGEEVVIAQDGDDLVGTVNGGADIVFVISVDSATGEVTLDQRRAVEHLDGGVETDDPATLSGTDLVVLTATAADKDTDEDSDSADITGAIAFDDDHPSVTRNATAAPELTVDDDDLGSSSADFSGLFDHDFGEDGEGGSGVDYELGINAGSTGLKDCATGQTVLLKLDGDDVVGYIGTDTEVFRVSVDSTGSVTLSQSRSIEHIVSGTPTDDPLTLAVANLITLAASVTDGDLDVASATAEIGQSLNFADAQPEFTDPADDLTVNFHAGQSGSESFAVDFHNDILGSIKIADGSLVYDGPFTPVVTDTKIEFYDGTTLVYHLDLTNDGYTVTVDATPPAGSVDLDFDAIKAGGPQETLSVPLMDDSDTIIFNGVIDGLEWTTSDRDHLNPDSLGFGLKGGQASQINPHEGFFFSNAGSAGIDSLTFGIQGIGNIPSVVVHFQLYDDPNNTPNDFSDDVAIAGASGTINVTGLAGGNIVKYVDIEKAGVEYDSALVTFNFPALNKDGTEKDNQGIRVLDFSTEIDNPPIEDEFSFEIEATDGDEDVDLSGLITVTMDPFFI